MTGSSRSRAALKATIFMILIVLTGCMGINKFQNPEVPDNIREFEKTAQTEPVKLVFSAACDEQFRKIMDYYIGQACTDYPHIAIEKRYYPSEDKFWKVLPAAVASGTAPDIIGINNEGAVELMDKSIITPLDELIGKAGFDKERYVPSLIKGWTYNGKLYGIPLLANVTLFIINTDMWQKAGLGEFPRTMDEVVYAAQRLNDKGAGVYGICAPIHEFHISQYVHAFGGDWNYGKTINTPENARGIQFFADLYTKYHVAVSPSQLGFSGDAEAFAKGRVAMSTGGQWYVPMLRENAPDIKWTAIPIPEGTKQVTTTYAWAFSIMENCRDKEAAMRVIKAITKDENYEYFVKTRNEPPAVSKYMPLFAEQTPVLKNALDTIKSGMALNYPVDANRFKSQLVNGLESIIFKPGSETIQQLLEEMQNDFNP